MAVRVRKLAKELERTPDDLLLVLKELGYDRFRSPDDMISEEVAVRLRRAARTTLPRAIGSTPPAPSRPPPAATPEGDLMAELVPGVVRKGKDKPARVLPRPKSAPPSTAPAEIDRRTPFGPATGDRTELRDALAEERKRIEELRTAFEAERAALATARAELEVERARAAAEREAVEEARRAAEQAHERRMAGVERISLLALLEERGLRGTDEGERALAALASHRQLGRTLATLIPADPDVVRRILAERLVLVGGTIPEALAGLAAVTVSEDRADVPGGDRLAKALSRLGEQLLLNGRRRVALVGVPPRWHALLREGLDRRVELSFRPAGGFSTEDLVRMDLLVLWNASLPPDAPPAEGRVRVIDVQGGAVGDLVERVTQGLGEDAGS